MLPIGMARLAAEAVVEVVTGPGYSAVPEQLVRTFGVRGLREIFTARRADPASGGPGDDLSVPRNPRHYKPTHTRYFGPRV